MGKLLFCKECGDLKAVVTFRRSCHCKKSFGRYLANGKVRYGGPAVILGFPNEDLEILRGPATDTAAYVIHKVVVVAPTVGRRPASTVEYIG